MNAPNDGWIPCVGCGTKNPPGAEACSGCGHRFAGPAPIGDLPRMAPEPVEFRLEAEESRPSGLAVVGSVLGTIAALIGITLATLIAFVVAFLTTCATIDTKGDYLFLDVAAGLVVAGLVAVALAIGWGKISGRR